MENHFYLKIETQQSVYVTSGPLTLHYASLNLADFNFGIDHDVIFSEMDVKKISSSGTYQNTNDFFNSLSGLSQEKDELSRIFRYEGNSLWQFMPSYIWPNFYFATQLVELFEKLLSINSINQITACELQSKDLNQIWMMLLIELGQKRNIKINFIKKNPNTILLNYDKSRVYFKSLLIDLIRLVIFLMIIIKGNYVRNVVKKTYRDLIFYIGLAQRNWRINSKNQWQDEQFYPIWDEIRRTSNRPVLCIDVQYSVRALIEILLSKRDFTDECMIRWTHMFSYFTLNLGRRWAIKKYFSSCYLEMQTSINLQNLFLYRGLSLFSSLQPTLEYCLIKLAPKCINYLDCAEAAILRERPSIVVATYETGPWERAFLIKAGQMKVPTIGLQHGMILDDHYDYMHSDVVCSSNYSGHGFVIPDITCVWGPKWKAVLMQHGSYSRESLEITGNWKFDSLFDNDVGDKVEPNYCTGGNIEIAIFTSGFDSASAVQTCIDEIRKFKHVNLTFKAHPGEDIKPIIDVLARSGISKNRLYLGPTMDLLASSQIVISQHSTIIAEATIYMKPIVLIDFQKSNKSADYIVDGICLVAQTGNQLYESIKSMLSNPEVIKALQISSKQYVEQHFYKMDCNSSFRVVNIIENLVSSSMVKND